MKKLTLISLAVLISASGAFAGWWQTFGGPDRDEGTCVQQTSDGGYIVTGFTYSFGKVGNANIWLIKLDSLGHTQWTKTYGEGGGSSVWQTSDGGYVIGGTKLIRIDENGDTIWTRQYEGNCANPTSDGGCIITGRIGLNLLLMKLNENGDSLWAKLYKKGNAGNGGAFVEQTKDGGYIVTGGAVDTLNSQTYKSFLWLLKTDEVGDTQWTKSYGGEDWGIVDYGWCVRQTADGGYIVCGAITTDSLYNLMKTDSNGNVEWVKIRGAHASHCVEQTKDGGYILAGGTEWMTSISSSPTPLSGDLWLVKTNANGDTLWTRQYGGEGTDAGRYVQQTLDAGYIVVGYFGGGDLYLLKTDSLGLLGIVEKPTPVLEKKWQVLSAIGFQITLLYSEMPEGFRATVYDASGRKVNEIYNPSRSGKITWGSGFKSGVYFIKVISQQKSTTSKVVIVH